MPITEQQWPHATDIALTVLIASLPEPGSAADLAETVTDLLTRLRRITNEPATDVVRIALVIQEPTGGVDTARALREACGEAARGIAQGLARELGEGLRINVIRCDQAANDTIAPTLTFLASTGANFVTGSTIDLRSAS